MRLSVGRHALPSCTLLHKSGSTSTSASRFVEQILCTLVPNGRDLLLVANAPDHGARLYVQSVDGSAAGPISPEGSFPYMPAISPNGTKVATLADASTIYVYDLVRWVRSRRE